jgi:hypothetical protein
MGKVEVTVGRSREEAWVAVDRETVVEFVV